MPALLALKSPDQVTGLRPPGRPPLGTVNANVSSRKLPDTPEEGAVISHVFVLVSNVAVTEVAEGLNVMAALGTLRL
jgi:hypothetical protein